MSKIYISADIEGTCGIVHWDETQKSKTDYEYFAKQMTREVAAACQGAMSGGAKEILVKDAHDSARNIDPGALPLEAKIFRGWARDPYCMMAGLTKDFDGVFFTGYHSAAGMDGNPLAHTMNGQNNYVKINGEIASELMINCMTAAMLNVPVLFVTGDEMLCDWIKTKNQNIMTLGLNRGIGNGAVSIHPDLAVEKIRDLAEIAMNTDARKCMYPMPESFMIEINYKQHSSALRAGFYPGCRQTGTHSVIFESDNYMDVLKFILFCL